MSIIVFTQTTGLIIMTSLSVRWRNIRLQTSSLSKQFIQKPFVTKARQVTPHPQASQSLRYWVSNQKFGTNKTHQIIIGEKLIKEKKCSRFFFLYIYKSNTSHHVQMVVYVHTYMEGESTVIVHSMKVEDDLRVKTHASEKADASCRRLKRRIPPLHHLSEASLNTSTRHAQTSKVNIQKT